MRNEKLQRTWVKLVFEGLLTVEPIGRSGGLAFLWKDLGEVDIINYSLRHICASIKLRGSDFQWKFTGFYGNPNRALREDSWHLLNHLSSYSP